MAGYLGAIPVPQATQHRESFTATSGQTTFNTAGYTVGFLDVYLNGSHLSPADFTATNGSDVVLASGASTGDVCDIISYTAFEVADQTFTGTTTLTGDLLLGDNDKAIFGAGSDLQIYHDGSNSYIDDAGTGVVALRGSTVQIGKYTGELMAQFVSDGAVQLRYDNSTKLATTSTGIDVTGAITADGLTVQNVNDSTTNTAEFRNDNGNRTFRFAQNTSGDADLLLEKNDGTDAVLISTHSDSYFNGGNVGIGTSSPSSLLHLEDDTPIITLRDTSAYSAGTGPYIRFQGNDSGSTARTFGEIYGLSNGSNSGDLAFYTRNSGSTAERMRINSTGAVTMPSQPYFAVEIDGNGNYTNTASTVALPFNTAVHNIGNHFNTSTYRFTAPITGKYLMAVGVIHNQANPTGRLMFYLNGNSDGGYIKWGINGSNTAGGGSHTATSIIYMSAGDYVDVRSHSGIINNYQDNHSSWTGMLLG